MLFFRSEDALDEWCKARQHLRRPTATLPQLWQMVVAWYANRLSAQARRPDTSEIRQISIRSISEQHPHETCRSDRQFDREGGALARSALNADAASVRNHDLPHDIQTETHPAVATHRDGALEAIEDPLLIFPWDADAVITDRQPRGDVRALNRNLHRLTRAVLDRVGEQVRQHLINPQLVPRSDSRFGA